MIITIIMGWPPAGLRLTVGQQGHDNQWMDVWMIWPWHALNYFPDVILSFECSRLTDVVINDLITVFDYHSSNLAN